jgi:hypothetical protein
MPGLVEITMTAGHGKFQEPNSNNVPRYKSSEAIKEKSGPMTDV